MAKSKKGSARARLVRLMFGDGAIEHISTTEIDRRLASQYAAMARSADEGLREAGIAGLVRMATGGDLTRRVRAAIESARQSNAASKPRKLTAKQVQQIRRTYESAPVKYGQIKALAAQFDVDRTTIRNIVKAQK